MLKPISVAVLTVSDRCSAELASDTSGPALVAIVTEKLGATIHATACLPDDRSRISQQLVDWAASHPAPDVILTTGGTGLSARDVTPEATLDVLERRHSALPELIRLRCLAQTPLAFLSRGEAGTIRTSLVINLPGSERGATESLRAILDVLPHAVSMLRNEAHGVGYVKGAASSTG